LQCKRFTWIRKCQTKTILALVIGSNERDVSVDVIFWCWYPVSITKGNNCNYFYDYQFSDFTNTYIIPKWNIFRRGKLSKYYFMKKNAPCSVLFKITNRSRGGSQNISSVPLYPPTSLNTVFVYIIKHISMYTIYYDNNILL